MKSYGGLYERICGWENLLLAARRARRRKRYRADVDDFFAQLEPNLLRLHEELATMTYRPSGYRRFKIREPKPRLISAAPFRDRVVHHALCNVIEPILERRMVFDSYSCRTGKGTHAALNRFKRFARSTKYVLRIDIEKYFDSIDQELLVQILGKTIRCPRTFWLIGQIVESTAAEWSDPVYYPGDDLFTPLERAVGLPIGNLTSQLFANVYLDLLDHFIKEDLRVRRYVRYTDDMALFSDDKAYLWHAMRRIEGFLEILRLRANKKKTRVVPVAHGVSFLGFRFYGGRVRIRKSAVTRFKSRMRRLAGSFAVGLVDAKDIRASLPAWTAHAGYCDTVGLRKRIIGQLVFSRERSKSGGCCGVARGTTT